MQIVRKTFSNPAMNTFLRNYFVGFTTCFAPCSSQTFLKIKTSDVQRAKQKTFVLKVKLFTRDFHIFVCTGFLFLVSPSIKSRDNRKDVKASCERGVGRKLTSSNIYIFGSVNFFKPEIPPKTHFPYFFLSRKTIRYLQIDDSS